MLLSLPVHQLYNSQHLKTALTVIILFALALTQGCSTFEDKPTPTASEQKIEWHALKRLLQSQTDWSLIGKVNVRTVDDSITAAINTWSQSSDSFNIELSSTFMGIGASRITGTSNYITLYEAGQDPISSDNPNQLLEASLGLPLPITHLPYWIKGLPAPEEIHRLTFNSQGTVAQLKQGGWTINYSRYSKHNHLHLPGKIKLSREQTKITMAIKEWTLH